MTLFIMEFPPSSCYFLLLTSKYSPQHPVLIHTPSSLPFTLQKLLNYQYRKPDI